MTPLPFAPETELEFKICADPEWLEGAHWGDPRPGHPEGAVMHHVAEVLQNVDKLATSPEERESLRLIALLHDTFKHRVDIAKPREGMNHHAAIARAFSTKYISDVSILEIIELHDEAYNSWRQGAAKQKWEKAITRVDRLLDRLGVAISLYLLFYKCDNATGSKSQDSIEWFENYLRSKSLPLP